ncbi:hypothetical protein AYO38_00125 [bacterium SCGC AG-212-C10]|nr:hypothetical protein AYO38_00125 [bacterium SCGC AG-212-C10]
MLGFEGTVQQVANSYWLVVLLLATSRTKRCPLRSHPGMTRALVLPFIVASCMLLASVASAQAPLQPHGMNVFVNRVDGRPDLARVNWIYEPDVGARFQIERAIAAPGESLVYEYITTFDGPPFEQYDAKYSSYEYFDPISPSAALEICYRVTAIVGSTLGPPSLENCIERESIQVPSFFKLSATSGSVAVEFSAIEPLGAVFEIEKGKLENDRPVAFEEIGSVPVRDEGRALAFLAYSFTDPAPPDPSVSRCYRARVAWIGMTTDYTDAVCTTVVAPGFALPTPIRIGATLQDYGSDGRFVELHWQNVGIEGLIYTIETSFETGAGAATTESYEPVAGNAWGTEVARLVPVAGHASACYRLQATSGTAVSDWSVSACVELAPASTGSPLDPPASIALSDIHRPDISCGVSACFAPYFNATWAAQPDQIFEVYHAVRDGNGNIGEYTHLTTVRATGPSVSVSVVLNAHYARCVIVREVSGSDVGSFSAPVCKETDRPELYDTPVPTAQAGTPVPTARPPVPLPPNTGSGSGLHERTPELVALLACLVFAGITVCATWRLRRSR